MFKAGWIVSSLCKHFGIPIRMVMMVLTCWWNDRRCEIATFDERFDKSDFWVTLLFILFYAEAGLCQPGFTPRAMEEICVLDDIRMGASANDMWCDCNVLRRCGLSIPFLHSAFSYEGEASLVGSFSQRSAVVPRKGYYIYIYIVIVIYIYISNMCFFDFLCLSQHVLYKRKRPKRT